MENVEHSRISESMAEPYRELWRIPRTEGQTEEDVGGRGGGMSTCFGGNDAMLKMSCYSIGFSLKVSRVVVVDLLVLNGWTFELVCLDTLSEVRVEFLRKGMCVRVRFAGRPAIFPMPHVLSAPVML